MSYCRGLQYYCKLGATSQAVHICYVSSPKAAGQGIRARLSLLRCRRGTAHTNHLLLFPHGEPSISSVLYCSR
uniref:Uncharacterized protein n=1 Tax=Dromaius novaehollandiae TaxID=8790 RepID=A0A8C4KDA1_DRONO